MLRLGFQPVFKSLPNAFVSSTRIALPELGSPAPPIIQASRWFPMSMVSSAFVPLMIPTTSQIGVMVLLITLLMLIVAPGAGPVL